MGHLTIEGHKVHLRVGLPSAFPLSLPEISLVKIEPALELSHLADGKRLCFEADTNLLLDRHDPWGIVQESLARACGLLRRLLSGGQAEEFVQEILAYWSTLSFLVPSVGCIVAATDHPHLTKVLYEGDTPIGVADEPFDFGQSLGTRKNDRLARQNAIYIPIDPLLANTAFIPRELLSLESLRKYVRALPERDRVHLGKLLKQCTQRQELVVLGVKRPRGDRALLGVYFPALRGKHPLADEHAQDQLVPMSLVRRDHAFLAPRGGADVDLRRCRILLTGCGAIGGHLALLLARAGIGHLTLVDPDVFSLENTYRHACGMARPDILKVTGLQHEIQRLVPYITVDTHPKPLETLLAEQPQILTQHELVLSAMGHPTVEMHLNEQLWSSESHPPALFAWVEPFGLGGHVLASHVRSDGGGFARGCLECLYHHPDADSPLENRAAFATPGVHYGRDTLGCGSTYLPFADMDAMRTAETAARLALRILRRELTGASLLSWKGDPTAFEQAGFTVTPRFAAMPGPFIEEQTAYLRADCPVCAA
ncbi:ThiF family adenylyltransferase [Stigmatella erecta]|uniref:ThiF family adenylyltransferase n=1 Tax=Stigmatella erecta TaxID=83460 RepID=UPI0015A6754E|nr:ThiF family adenylyltransferase [Stigmatella erecta]